MRLQRSLLAALACFTVASGLSARTAEPAEPRFFIQEYLVEGVHLVRPVLVEQAVYRFLGPKRTKDDVERARAAVEKLYHQLGFQTVTVRIPEQPISAAVRLVVNEVPVGRLRVRGATYTAPSKVKALAPSLGEGKVVNFNAVPQEMSALNGNPDRQVTPSIHQGATPGTVDVDLEVKEKSPVHASVELNNRHGADTKPLRLNLSLSDSNIAQSGHGVGASFQTAPEAPKQVRVFSGYYSARFPAVPGFGLMVQGTKQNSNVSTLGSVAVAGRGQTLGLRGNFDLPSQPDFFQSASIGLDYKHFLSEVNLAASGSTPASLLTTPITYYPLSASYTATWKGKTHSTDVNVGLSFNLRTTETSSTEFNTNRYGADSNFVVLHSDLSHTRELWRGVQIFGKVQGQLADQPLVNSEQLSGGGSGTVRGYLEAEALGDNGAFGTLELRSPSILPWLGRKAGDWRWYAFYEGGYLNINQPLPSQTSYFRLASYGLGTRVQLFDHFDGAVDAAMPQATAGTTKPQTVHVTFRAALNY